MNKEKLKEQINLKWNRCRRNMCSENDWYIPDSVLGLAELKGEELCIKRECVIPVVPIICLNCGNTVLVNPVVIEAD